MTKGKWVRWIKWVDFVETMRKTTVEKMDDPVVSDGTLKII